MKKIISILFYLLCSISINAQHFRYIYTDVDTLDVSNISIGAEEFLINLPTSVIIAYNKDKSKAIVLKNGYLYGKHFEFNVKDDPTRLILWYKNKKLYCGYIQDKRVKTAKYFEAINKEEKDKLSNRIPFIKHIPYYEDNIDSNSR